MHLAQETLWTLGLREFFLHPRFLRSAVEWAQWTALMQRLHTTARALSFGNSLIRDCKWKCPNFAPERDVTWHSKQICPLLCLHRLSSLQNPWKDSLKQRTSILLLAKCAHKRPLENCLPTVLSNEHASDSNYSYQNFLPCLLILLEFTLEYIFLYHLYRRQWWLTVQLKYKELEVQRKGGTAHHRAGPLSYKCTIWQAVSAFYDILRNMSNNNSPSWNFLLKKMVCGGWGGRKKNKKEREIRTNYSDRTNNYWEQIKSLSTVKSCG